MDEDVVAKIAAINHPIEGEVVPIQGPIGVPVPVMQPRAERIVNTFVSEIESTGPQPSTPPRMVNVAASSGAILKVKSSPADKPMPRPAEAPVRKPFDVDLGTLESLCGEVVTHRVLIPVPNAEDRASAKVRLEQETVVASLRGVTATGGHLVLNVQIEYRVSGQYEVNVIVEFRNGKVITGKATVIIKHNKPQPFGLSGVIGGQSDGVIPFMGQLWKETPYVAHFEPPLNEFRLTDSKGKMKAGAKVFPFRVIFAPKDAKPIVALLVVVFDAKEEYTVEITGSTAGFTGRQWIRRAKTESVQLIKRAIDPHGTSADVE
jgi:hypothetical protein